MNKNLKKIIAIALAFGTVSAVAPATHINLLTTKAYAEENDDTELSSLKLLNSSDSSIKLYESDDYDSDEKVDSDDVSEGDTYYAKTSSSKVKIDISGVKDKYVKVFKGTSDSARGKDPGDEISISDDTTITVKIYDEDVSGDTVKYEDDDYNSIGDYTIEIEYTGSDSDDEDDDSSSTDADDYDDIYLDKLTVDGESISLSEDKVAYTYNVPNSTKEVSIKAVPEDEDDDDVTIDDSDVDDSDSWKKKVSLNEGENKFKIEIENDDDDESRTYTLTINRAKATATNTNTATTQPSTSTGTTPAATTKVGWSQVNGRWQYFDSFGRQYKSQWFFDRNYGKWYYLGADGNMYTGWLLDGGKYYYLNADGSMASNTTIGGYKLGSDGAWVR